MPDRAVEPRWLYGPRVAALRNQATHHTGAPPAPGPHSSARTRRQAPKTSGRTLLEDTGQECGERWDPGLWEADTQDWSQGRHLTLLEASWGSVASRRARNCLSCSAGWRPTRVSETGFGEPGDPLVLVRQVQGLCTDLLIQPEETQVSRNRGAGGAAEPATTRPGSWPGRTLAARGSGGPA